MFSEYLDENSRCVLAFSGGADSRYLLEKINEKIEKKEIQRENIILAHYNHNLRGEESLRDQEFSREIAKKFGVLFETQTRNISDEKKENDKKISENTARNLRYTFLEHIRKKYSAECIITAHHQDDQAETVFLQFLRGGSINALSGMKIFCEERKIFRPFLSISKKKILEELEKKKILFCEDSTNAESEFTRNFLRNKIFPSLEEKFPNFSLRLAKNTKHFSEMQEEYENEAKKFFERNSFEKGVSRDFFFSLLSGIRFEIIKKLLFPRFCDKKIFREIEKCIKTGDSGKKIEVKNMVFQVFGEKVFFSKAEEKKL